MNNNLSRKAENLSYGGNIPAPYLERLSPEMIKALDKGLLKNVFDGIIYDSVRYKAAAAFPTDPIELYSVPRGAQGTVINDASIKYNKTARDTNLKQARLLGDGREFWVFSIEVFFVNVGASVAGYKDTTLPKDLAPSGLASAVTNAHGILSDGVLSIKLGDEDYDEGHLYNFPQLGGLSASAGAGSATNFEAVAQNGNGNPRLLSMGHVITSDMTLGSTVTWFSGIIPQNAGELRFIKRGLWVRRVS